MKRIVLAGLALLGGCNNVQLSLTLLTPVDASDGGFLDPNAPLSIAVTWEGGGAAGGDAGVSGVFGGQNLSLSVPTGTLLDVVATGEGWRGELHRLLLHSSGTVNAQLLMLPVGHSGWFPSISLPPLSGETVAALDAGLLLIVGGTDGGLAWFWDQAAVAFHPAPSTQLPWAHHAMLDVGNGTFLLAGGDYALDGGVEFYSPFGDGGTIDAGVLGPQRHPSAVAVSGNIFLGCGADAGLVVGLPAPPSTASPDCVDGALVTQSEEVLAIGATRTTVVADGVTFPPPLSPRLGFATVSNGVDGGVFLLGGFQPDAGANPLQPTTSTELLTSSDAAAAPPLLAPRAEASVVDLRSLDAGALVVGGVIVQGPNFGSLEIWPNPADGAAPIPIGTSSPYPAAALIPGYRIVFILSGEPADAGASNGLDFYAVP